MAYSLLNTVIHTDSVTTGNKMTNIGIFFGTETGYTRRIAKTIAKRLSGLAGEKPTNINRTTIEQFLAYDALVLGTPTYGEGQLPGKATGIEAGSWAEFIPQLAGQDMAGKRVAIYGFGDQSKYSDRFANAMRDLYDCVISCGGTVVGAWPTDGYTFSASRAVINNHFIGLALDEKNQSLLTNERVDQWVSLIKPKLAGC
jgi:flavodoxin I